METDVNVKNDSDHLEMKFSPFIVLSNLLLITEAIKYGYT